MFCRPLFHVLATNRRGEKHALFAVTRVTSEINSSHKEITKKKPSRKFTKKSDERFYKAKLSSHLLGLLPQLIALA